MQELVDVIGKEAGNNLKKTEEHLNRFLL